MPLFCHTATPSGSNAPDDGCGRPQDVEHDGGLFVSVELENGLAIVDRDDEEVAAAALFVGDEQRGEVASIEDGVRPLARQVLAERTWTRRREKQRHLRSSSITCCEATPPRTG